jgi:hypothetical protein
MKNFRRKWKNEIESKNPSGRETRERVGKQGVGSLTSQFSSPTSPCAPFVCSLSLSQFLFIYV